jgi:hypothetical protein
LSADAVVEKRQASKQRMLEEGEEVNARGVWKRKGKEEFMYYTSSHNGWIINDRKNMEAGKDAGWMTVASTALTPDKITETWQVADTSIGAWVDAAGMKMGRSSSDSGEGTVRVHLS